MITQQSATAISVSRRVPIPARPNVVSMRAVTEPRSVSCFACTLHEAAADDLPAAVGLALEDIKSALRFAVLVNNGDVLGGPALNLLGDFTEFETDRAIDGAVSLAYHFHENFRRWKDAFDGGSRVAISSEAIVGPERRDLVRYDALKLLGIRRRYLLRPHFRSDEKN